MFWLPVCWSFVISPPCTALCCPISSVSHFSWSPFVRQPPITKQCHITGWVLWGGKGLFLTVCSFCKCETLWNVYIKPHTHYISNTQCQFQSFPRAADGRWAALVQHLRMLRHNAAPWWQPVPVQTLCRSSPLSSFSSALIKLTVFGCSLWSQQLI